MISETPFIFKYKVFYFILSSSQIFFHSSINFIVTLHLLLQSLPLGIVEITYISKQPTFLHYIFS